MLGLDSFGLHLMEEKWNNFRKCLACISLIPPLTPNAISNMDLACFFIHVHNGYGSNWLIDFFQNDAPLIKRLILVIFNPAF